MLSGDPPHMEWYPCPASRAKSRGEEGQQHASMWQVLRGQTPGICNTCSCAGGRPFLVQSSTSTNICVSLCITHSSLHHTPVPTEANGSTAHGSLPPLPWGLRHMELREEREEGQHRDSHRRLSLLVWAPPPPLPESGDS